MGNGGGSLLSRRRVFAVIEIAQEGDRLSQVFDWSILVLILANAVAVVIGTVPSVQSSCGSQLHVFEQASVAIFTIEYLLRMWAAPERDASVSALSARVKWSTSPLALIDLAAILPAFLPMLLPVDLRLLRLLRLFRLLRLLKLGRYSQAIQVFSTVLKEKREELVVALVSVLILLTLTSGAMYYFENPGQPEAFPSIPAAMWWGTAALTTVGYGDVYPITTAGRILGSLTALLGIGFFALPAGILASGFSDAIARAREDRDKC